MGSFADTPHIVVMFYAVRCGNFYFKHEGGHCLSQCIFTVWNDIWARLLGESSTHFNNIKSPPSLQSVFNAVQRVCSYEPQDSGVLMRGRGTQMHPF